jgi:hypothetical protein
MKTVLVTENCRIVQTEKGYQVLMLARSGDWIANHPHSPDLKGLVGALTLAIDVIAGKVWLEGIARPEPNSNLLKQIHLIKDGDI